MPDIRHHAIDWLRRGYFPVPVPFREKGPKLENWQNLRLTESEIPNYFNGQPQNLGVQLGEPYGNCDVDLDSPEAVTAWPLFAPDTGLIFGRKSKPRSHWFYRIDPPCRSVKYLDPVHGATLLEFRCLKADGSVGLQTVVPPSVHPSGEAVEFWRDGEAANVDSGDLGRAVRWTAAAALLKRHWPAEGGGRHDAFLALAGALAYAHWEIGDATALVSALYRLLWPNGADLSAAAREVESTFQRFDDGHEITGIPHLVKLVSPAAVKSVGKWLGLRQEPERQEPSIPDYAATIPSVWEMRCEVSWLIEGVFSEGNVNLITGDSGDGKSTLALGLAGAVAYGADFLGRQTQKRRVLYVDRENPLATIKERLLRLHIPPTDDLQIWGVWCEANPEGPGAAGMIEFAKKYRPLMIFDPLVSFLEGDENDAIITRRHMNLYRKLASVGATIVILHHTGKGDTAKECRGSSDIKGSVDIGVLLERADGSPAASKLAGLRLRAFKTRLVAIDPIRFDYVDGRFVSADGPLKSSEELVYDGLRLNPGCTQKELIAWAGQRGITWHKTREILERLVLERKVTAWRGKGRGNTIRYYLPDTDSQGVP